MQSFDTENNHTTTSLTNSPTNSDATSEPVTVSSSAEISAGASARLELPDGNEVAVFNVDGEFYAIDNSCPHKGAPLSEGQICGHIVECALHGWQFDVRTGECLTVPERIRTYKVRNEEGLLKIEIR
jgi:Ferredoxin subunits of nitrite reductase and ring-hydroxylating dioxygenases